MHGGRSKGPLCWREQQSPRQVASVQAVRPESAPATGAVESAQQALGAWPVASAQVARQADAVVLGGSGSSISPSLGGERARVGAWVVPPECAWESPGPAVARLEVGAVQALEAWGGEMLRLVAVPLWAKWSYSPWRRRPWGPRPSDQRPASLLRSRTRREPSCSSSHLGRFTQLPNPLTV